VSLSGAQISADSRLFHVRCLLPGPPWYIASLLIQEQAAVVLLSGMFRRIAEWSIRRNKPTEAQTPHLWHVAPPGALVNVTQFDFFFSK
jgi:hypothetical protein